MRCPMCGSACKLEIVKVEVDGEVVKALAFKAIDRTETIRDELAEEIDRRIKGLELGEEYGTQD